MKSEFLSHIKETMWTRRYAKPTIESYLYWLKAYMIFIGKIQPKDCHDKDVERYLSDVIMAGLNNILGFYLTLKGQLMWGSN